MQGNRCPLRADHPMDVWSIGCVIYELFTGRILFPGRSNNEMLKHMMDVKGAFPKKMLKRAEFRAQHFEDDPNMSFCLMETDPLTNRAVSPTPTPFFGRICLQVPPQHELLPHGDRPPHQPSREPDPYPFLRAYMLTSTAPS